MRNTVADPAATRPRIGSGAVSSRRHLIVCGWLISYIAATDLADRVHHSDAGSQYTHVAFTGRLAAEGILPSIGTVGDSYDNALAESVNSSYKNELIYRQLPYPGVTELSLATAEWVALYNHQRPNGYCQDLTPNRPKALLYHRLQHPETEEALK